MSSKPKVAFICVHNSCRSQIAEALSKFYNDDVYEAYSAGTHTRPQINQDAVRLMKSLYGIDMEETQRSKTLEEIPPIDIVITMGCEVDCPMLPCSYREDWGLEDPSGQSDQKFLEIINQIDTHVSELATRILSDEFALKTPTED
jgi:arsenate reductase